MTDDYYPKDGPSVHSRNVDYIPGKKEVKKEEAEKAEKKEEVKEEKKGPGRPPKK